MSRRVSEMKDPVIVWDRYRGAYWKDEGRGYTCSSLLAGIFERHEAPKGDSDRKIDLEPVPEGHQRYTQEALEDARAALATLTAERDQLAKRVEELEGAEAVLYDLVERAEFDRMEWRWVAPTWRGDPNDAMKALYKYLGHTQHKAALRGKEEE